MSAKQDEKIKITSSAELHSRFDSLRLVLAEPETEDTWARLDKALSQLELVTKGGGYKFEDYVALMKDKEISRPINNSLLSERTRISGTAADLLNSVAPRLADRFDPLIPVFLPALLQLCARTNKVALKRAQKTLLLICAYCRLPSSLLPFFREAAKDKVPSLRAVAVECTLALVNGMGVNGSEKDQERLGRRGVPDAVEAILRSGATDASVEVRSLSKKLFGAYMASMPERVEAFTAPLTPTIRRYLALPKTGALKPAILQQSSHSSASTSSGSSSDHDHSQPFPMAVPPLKILKRSASAQQFPQQSSQRHADGFTVEPDPFSSAVHYTGVSGSSSDPFHNVQQATTAPSSAEGISASRSMSDGLSRSNSLHTSTASSSSSRSNPFTASIAASSSSRKVSSGAAAAYQRNAAMLAYAKAWGSMFPLATSSSSASAAPAESHKRERTTSATSLNRHEHLPQQQHLHHSHHRHRDQHLSHLESEDRSVPMSKSLGQLHREIDEHAATLEVRSTESLSASIGPGPVISDSPFAPSENPTQANVTVPITPANPESSAPVPATPRSAPSAGVAERLAQKQEEFLRQKQERAREAEEVEKMRLETQATAGAAAAVAAAIAKALATAPPATPGFAGKGGAKRRQAPPMAVEKPQGTAKKASRVLVAAPTPANLSAAVAPPAAPRNANDLLRSAISREVKTEPKPAAPSSATTSKESGDGDGAAKAASKGTTKSSATSATATHAFKAGPASMPPAKIFKPNTSNIVHAKKMAAAAAIVPKPRVGTKSSDASKSPRSRKTASSTTMKTKAPLPGVGKASTSKLARPPLLTQKKIASQQSSVTKTTGVTTQAKAKVPVSAGAKLTEKAATTAAAPARRPLTAPTKASLARQAAPVGAAKAPARRAAAPRSTVGAKATRSVGSKSIASQPPSHKAPPQPASHAQSSSQAERKSSVPQAAQEPTQNTFDSDRLNATAEEQSAQPMSGTESTPGVSTSSGPDEVLPVQEVICDEGAASQPVQPDCGQTDECVCDDAVNFELDEARQDVRTQNEACVRVVDKELSVGLADETEQVGQEEAESTSVDFELGEESVPAVEGGFAPTMKAEAIAALDEGHQPAAAKYVQEQSDEEVSAADGSVIMLGAEEEGESPELPTPGSDEALISDVAEDVGRETSGEHLQGEAVLSGEHIEVEVESLPAPTTMGDASASPIRKILTRSAANSPALTPSRALGSINLNTRVLSPQDNSRETSPSKICLSARKSLRNSAKKFASPRRVLRRSEAPDLASSDGHMLLEHEEGAKQLVFGASDFDDLDEDTCAEDDTIILQPGLRVH